MSSASVPKRKDAGDPEIIKRTISEFKSSYREEINDENPIFSKGNKRRRRT